VYPEIMEDFPVIGGPRRPFRKSGRLTSFTSLGAITVLGLAGWMHFSGPAEEPPPARQTARSAANNDQRRVSPIHHEVDENAGTSVVTASATSLGAASQDGVEPESHAGAASEPQSADDRQRQAILGKWEDEYRGKRHLTVREDGTGSMVVEPDGIGKRLFAPELTLELEWTVADGRATMKMIRGEPKSKVQLILKLYGQEAEYQILELTGEQMLLLDPDGKTRYDWRRPGANRDAAQ
jgi:hypothetical protein